MRRPHKERETQTFACMHVVCLFTCVMLKWKLFWLWLKKPKMEGTQQMLTNIYQARLKNKTFKEGRGRILYSKAHMVSRALMGRVERQWHGGRTKRWSTLRLKQNKGFFFKKNKMKKTRNKRRHEKQQESPGVQKLEETIKELKQGATQEQTSNAGVSTDITTWNNYND